MSLYPFEPSGLPRERRPANRGFGVGLVAAGVMVAVHLTLLLINAGSNRGDVLAWLLQLVVYFLAGRAAAGQQHQAQQANVDHVRGVRAAGVGAALVTSVLVWVYIIVRGLLRDALGLTVMIEPVSLFAYIVLDVLLALAIGAWGGHTVARKYDGFSGY